MTVIDFSLPSSSIDVSTPEGLLEVLRRGVFKPAQSQFQALRDDGDAGFCCLGVYAEVNQIAYDHDDGAFHEISDDSTSDAARLPDDHWLFTKVITINMGGSKTDGPLQFVLSRANDQDDSDSYELPIQVLEAFIAGCRTFRWTGSSTLVPVFEDE